MTTVVFDIPTKLASFNVFGNAFDYLRQIFIERVVEVNGFFFIKLGLRKFSLESSSY